MSFKMSLWVDKYRPTSLGDLDYHVEQATGLANMIQAGDFPHLLVYGPPGAGKRTRIMGIIRELYGSGVDKLQIKSMHFETPSRKKLEIITISSNYHIEVNPSTVGKHDRVVIMDLIKTVAQTHQLNSTRQREFKVIFLTNADQLSEDAQHALRGIMEKYSSTCRIILCANSTSRVLPAIRSRCLGIRIPAPKINEITTILESICKREGLSFPHELATKIAKASEGNLRRAIIMLENCKVQQYPFFVDQYIAEFDWKVYLRNTAKLIIAEQSPKMLIKFGELVEHCDLELTTEIVTTAAEYEYRMHHGSKAIFHLEAFVARFMAIYEKFMDSFAGDFLEDFLI